MNDNKFVDDLSLEFFLNKDLYSKYLEKKSCEKTTEYKKDKRFYRKRITDLTKQLLIGNGPNIKDIEIAFDIYSRICIDYFKNLDKTDIIQEDYTGFINIPSDNLIKINDGIDTLEGANNFLMRSFKINEPNSLEKLVKKTSTKVLKKEMHLPIQKDINLKDPILKKKGIKKDKKKNNITNIYEEENKKQEEFES